MERNNGRSCRSYGRRTGGGGVQCTERDRLKAFGERGSMRWVSGRNIQWLWRAIEFNRVGLKEEIMQEVKAGTGWAGQKQPEERTRSGVWVVLKRDIREDEIHRIGQRVRTGLVQQAYARDTLLAGVSCNLDCMPYSTSDSRSASESGLEPKPSRPNISVCRRHPGCVVLTVIGSISKTNSEA
jgi:hypothetical protein